MAREFVIAYRVGREQALSKRALSQGTDGSMFCEEIGGNWGQEGAQQADAAQWGQMPASSQMHSGHDPMSRTWHPMAQPMPYPSPRWGHADPAAAYHFGAEQYAQQAAFLSWLMPQPQMGEPPGPPAPQGILFFVFLVVLVLVQGERHCYISPASNQSRPEAQRL